MTEHNVMLENFQVLFNQEKRFVLSKLGAPAVLFHTFVIYHKNNLWMVLFFKDVRDGDEFRSVLRAVSFFDNGLKLLWSSGIQLMPEMAKVMAREYKTVDEVAAAYGEPHAETGGGRSVYQYLTDDGHIVFLEYENDKILHISQMSLPELAEKFEKVQTGH